MGNVENAISVTHVEVAVEAAALSSVRHSRPEGADVSLWNIEISLRLLYTRWVSPVSNKR